KSLGALQVTGAPLRHTPPLHRSTPLHLLPSSHEVSSGNIGFEQRPVTWSHVPGPWQRSWAGQPMGAPSVQTPSLQAAVPLLLVSPVQLVPSGRFGLEHSPVVGSQVPTPWQIIMALHTTGVPGLQIPLWHFSRP